MDSTCPACITEATLPVSAGLFTYTLRAKGSQPHVQGRHDALHEAGRKRNQCNYAPGEGRTIPQSLKNVALQTLTFRML